MRQPGCSHSSHFIIQISEYLANHYRVFDTGDDAHITAAFTAGFDAEEVIAQDYLLGTYMKLYENNHYQYQLGFLSEDHWQGSLEEMKCQFELPFYRTLLLGWRFREEFSKLIEQAKREAINIPSGCWTFAPDHPIYN